MSARALTVRGLPYACSRVHVQLGCAVVPAVEGRTALLQDHFARRCDLSGSCFRPALRHGARRPAHGARRARHFNAGHVAGRSTRAWRPNATTKQRELNLELRLAHAMSGAEAPNQLSCDPIYSPSAQGIRRVGGAAVLSKVWLVIRKL